METVHSFPILPHHPVKYEEGWSKWKLPFLRAVFKLNTPLVTAGRRSESQVADTVRITGESEEVMMIYITYKADCCGSLFLPSILLSICLSVTPVISVLILASAYVTCRSLCSHKMGIGQCDAGNIKHAVGYGLSVYQFPAVFLGRKVTEIQQRFSMI